MGGERLKPFRVLIGILDDDVPLNVLEKASSTVRNVLRETLPELIPVEVGLARVEGVLKEETYNPIRGQYRGDIVLRRLEKVKKPGWTRVVGVTSRDLYAPGLNFVFGQARYPGRVAVVSTARLAHPDERAFVKRLATEILHELGHTVGLGHCSDPSCVMSFSNHVGEVDEKGPGFCPSCAEVLLKRVLEVTGLEE